MEQIETVEQIKKQILETNLHLEDLEKKLYELQNKELFEKVDSNIGKCFRMKNSGTGCSEYLRIEGINKKNKTYIIRHIISRTMLIGLSDFSISYYEISFRGLEFDMDLWNTWEEVTNEKFIDFVNYEIEFELKCLKDFNNE